MARSLDGLVFVPVADQAPGQVGLLTRFEYHEQDGRVWAEYRGGDVARATSSAPAPTAPSNSATSSSGSTARPRPGIAPRS